MKFFKSIFNKYEGVNVIGKAVYLCSRKRVKLFIVTIFQGMGVHLNFFRFFRFKSCPLSGAGVV